MAGLELVARHLIKPLQEKIGTRQTSNDIAAIPFSAVEIELIRMVFFEPANRTNTFRIQLFRVRIIFLARDGDAEFCAAFLGDSKIFRHARRPMALKILFVIDQLWIPREHLVELTMVAPPIVIGTIGFILRQDDIEFLPFIRRSLRKNGFRKSGDREKQQRRNSPMRPCRASQPYVPSHEGIRRGEPTGTSNRRRSVTMDR